MHRTALLLSLGLALSPATARAQSWAMIDAVETPGDRSVYFAMYDAVKTYADPGLSGVPASRGDLGGERGLPENPFASSQVTEIEVVQVFEAADKPRASNYRVAADCLRGRIRIAGVDSLYRDGSTAMGGDGADWLESAPSGWLSRVRVIACDRQGIDAAIQRSNRARSFDPLLDLGLLHVGDYALTYPLIELTWSAFWPEATEPPLRRLSAAELDALQRGNEARLAALKEQVAAYAATAGASLSDQTGERAFMTEVRAVFADKPRNQQVIFGGMAGWSQDEVVSLWGRPDQVRDAGGVRVLEYQATVDTRQLIVEQWAQAGEVAYEMGELQYCAVSFFMRPGGSRPGPRLIDVEVRGDNCRRSTLRETAR